MSAAHKKHTASKKATVKKHVVSPETVAESLGPQPMQSTPNVVPVQETPMSSEIKPTEQIQPVTVVDSLPTAPAAQPVAFVAPETEQTVLSAPITSVTPTPSAAIAAPVASDPLAGFKEKLQDDSLSSTPAKKNFMWPILFIFVIALVGFGGIFIYKQGLSKSEKVNEVVLTPAPIRIPSPTVAKADLSKYEVKILNGSETEGEAGRQKSNLEEKGFTISAIGNAVESDYTDTIIQAKKEVESAFLDKLKSVLELSFSIGEQDELPKDADSDVVVIIGSKKAN